MFLGKFCTIISSPIVLWPLSSLIICVLGVRDGFAACVYGLLLVGLWSCYRDFSKYWNAAYQFVINDRLRYATVKKKESKEVNANES